MASAVNPASTRTTPIDAAPRAQLGIREPFGVEPVHEREREPPHAEEADAVEVGGEHRLPHEDVDESGHERVARGRPAHVKIAA